MTSKQKIEIGPLSNRVSGKHYAPNAVTFTPPTRITNASSTEPYTGPNWQHRPGSQDFLACKSKGFI